MKQKTVRLGRTGIISGKNAFGALPIQRDDKQTAVKILRKAYDNGFTFFDTARAYTDSEEKIGEALSGVRDGIYIATKTVSLTPGELRKDLETSLSMLRTDHIDVYQFHNPAFCPKPGDGTGLYEEMEKARAEGKIRFIGITNHRLAVAKEAVESGLYDTLQFPFSYLSSKEEIDLVKTCRDRDVGFICMKALCGGLLTNAAAAYAFLDTIDNALPIWGIQRESELDEFISFIKDAPEMTPEISELIEKDRADLTGEFCRACGYCLSSCPQKISISQCARMIQLIRRSPSASHLSEESQKMMMKAKTCIECRACTKKCPYSLDIPSLLKKNVEDYENILSGKIKV